MSRTRIARLVAGLAGLALVALGLPAAAVVATSAGSGAEAAGDVGAQAQTLTWTADNSTTAYKSAPTEAVAGPTTIVFENSTATGNTSGMQHTLTFDTAGGDYNDDVDLDILAFPSDENDGKWTAEVTLTEGTYRYHCIIPGHGQMEGTLVVSGDGGGGGEDTTPPTVAAELAGDQDADGAYIGQATATLTATDADSEVESIEYRLDEGEWQTYGEPVVVDAPGDHVMGYRATDTAGNTSEEATTELTVVGADGPDTTAPTVEAMVHGEQNDEGAYLGAAEVMLSAEDAQSGVASIEYAVDGGEWQAYTDPFEVTGVGDHTVTHRATDQAGNVSEPGETTFAVAQAPDDDTEAPTVTASLAGDQDASWAFLGSVTATLAATDEGSGVDTVEYRLDGGEWQEYGDPVEIDEAGEHVMEHRATDLGGNVSEPGTVSFTVAADTAAPRCATPDPSPVVVVGDVGTQVRNRSVGGGCTVDDLIQDEARWADHATFVDHARSATQKLLDDGYLSAAERNQVVRAAQQSSVGHES